MIKESFNSRAIKVMNAYRGMYTPNTAYIPPNWKDIRNAYMNELYAICLQGRYLEIETLIGDNYGD